MSTPITRSGIEELRERIQRLEGAADRRRTVLPFGIKAIDRHLPGGGLARGALHEVAGGGNGAINGAAAALLTAGIAARTRGCLGDEKSVLICFEEGLRHGGLGAVVAEVARLSMTASRCENEAGERFWNYRSGDGEDGLHRWFLHGIFG
jgi:protein ImuA